MKTKTVVITETSWVEGLWPLPPLGWRIWNRCLHLVGFRRLEAWLWERNWLWMKHDRADE